MKFLLHGDRALLLSLQETLEEQQLAKELNLKSGPSVESERLSFELKDIASLAGLFSVGLKATEFAAALIKGRSRSKTPVIELRTPRGRIELDLSGKSQQEVTALIKAAYPFLD